jgi:hypothetical protein
LTPDLDDEIVVCGGRAGGQDSEDVVADDPEDDLVLRAEAERFERRLTEEVSGARAELHREISTLRLEMQAGFAALRQEMATMRADILKWSFLFWIGQVATITALLSFMLRINGR